jgi:chemotaxis regulatin CheY-phosphate phosphatase CheZ
MRKFIEKLFGIDKLRSQTEESLRQAEAAKKVAEDATTAAERAKDAEETAKLSPKDRATKLKEPWVGVLNTHINKDNIRNGFFELDWNDDFVLKLKQEGYGFDGDLDEEIVDRWFRELCANVVIDGDYGGAVNTGVIDIKTVKKNNK